MAGSGGFKNAINGFDKNEVNEYIGELRKKMQDMDNELKAKVEAADKAAKAADEANGRVNSLIAENEAKVQELEKQIKAERKNSDNLQNEIDELKRKLRNAGSGSNGANNAEAERHAAEIVEKANATARDIVEKAKQTAQQIIASAESSGGSGSSGGGISADALNSFNAILRGLTTSINDALRSANEKAAGISVSSGAPSQPAPALDLSQFETPQASVPESKPAPKPAAKAVENVDDIFSDILDDGGDMTDFGDPMDDKHVQHDSSARDVVDGFDLGGMNDIMDEIVTEVAPLEKKKNGDVVMDDGFAADLLAQTVPASTLKDLGEDFFAAAQERDAEFAVKPTDEETDFDMGSGESGLDAMNALLGQMGAALENAGGSADGDFENETSMNSSANDDPWADLQNQLNAMDESGNYGADSAKDNAPAASADDPKAPDADDSSIWNFDDMSSNSSNNDDDMNSGDDDMSSDLFGSF